MGVVSVLPCSTSVLSSGPWVTQSGNYQPSLQKAWTLLKDVLTLRCPVFVWMVAGIIYGIKDRSSERALPPWQGLCGQINKMEGGGAC